jgi:hypothetical protein
MARSIHHLLGLMLAASAFLPTTSHALIPTPVGGRPGQVDVSFRLSLERGKVEPNSNVASFQRANWEVYTLGAGYTHGRIGPLLDVTFRLEGSYFTSPAEINDPARGAVAAEDCITGDIPSAGRCQFHDADSGGYVSPSISFNVLHPGDFSLGFFVLSNVPIGIDFARFVVPRVDLIAGGVTVGMRMKEWLSFESRTYIGSGMFAGEHKQAATIALTMLFGFEAERWLLPWKIGVKLGPYFDGDLLGERTDPAYDAAYTAGYPERTDRIRMMRFGTAILPYVQLTEHAALELGYVQKIFGYDTPATQFYTVGARAAF